MSEYYSKLTEPAFIIAFLALVVPFAVYMVQQQSRYSQFFHDCATSLRSENPIEQSTAAILLRSFLKRPWWKFLYKPNYTQEAKNLMVELLGKGISANLRKTLADSFSYAGNLKGQDMQKVIMVDASIKPEYRIQYELAENFIARAYYKHRRLSMRKADFYHAVIQESSINNVNAKGAVFFSTILCRTSFNNCILNKANFKNSNVGNVRFDEDCLLEGASFMGAVGIDSATKKVAGEKKPHPLIEFLDENGVFQSKGVKPEERYVVKNEKINVFVSKLGSMDSQQRKRYDSTISAIKQLGNVEIQTIERDQYLSVSQLTDVETHLDHCDGCVIFAFEYLNVTSGYIHKNVEGNDRKEIKSTSFPSPWLHIEAALANGRQMPCLIIYEENLCRDGMFDDAIIQSDKNIFSLAYSDNFSLMDKIIISKWFMHVRDYYYDKNIRKK